MTETVTSVLKPTESKMEPVSSFRIYHFLLITLHFFASFCGNFHSLVHVPTFAALSFQIPVALRFSLLYQFCYLRLSASVILYFISIL